MFQVIKRDGSKSDFTLTKINDAIMKAFTATQMSYNNDIIDLLALRVTADFQKKVENDEIHVEDIQDSVERVLGQAGYEEVAKAYILYRKQREKMRAMKSTILDYKDASAFSSSPTLFNSFRAFSFASSSPISFNFTGARVILFMIVRLLNRLKC